jgi:hypothetical protein
MGSPHLAHIGAGTDRTGSPHLAHICAGTARTGSPRQRRRWRVADAWSPRANAAATLSASACSLYPGYPDECSEYACEYSEYACEYAEYPCGYPEYACSGNVICLDVLRAIKREPASAAGEYSESPAVSTPSSRLRVLCRE